LDVIFIRAPSASAFESTLARAQRVLAQPDQRVVGLSWITPESLLQRLRRWQKMVGLAAGSIALLCLILGGTTLMSLMVANVRDRVVEIGLRRSLGASRGDVAALFVIEGCLVTGGAGLVGSTLTWLILWLVQPRLPVSLHLGASTVLVPLGVAFALGLIFSYGPALAAARIAPSEALRSD
jgi:putative ABC transport system permease protein